MKNISVDELNARLKTAAQDSDTLYLDVRMPSEYRAEHVSGLKNIELDVLSDHLDEVKGYKSAVLFCASGNRSVKAAKILAPHIQEVINVKGGLVDWKHADLPTVKGTATGISVMRQVQIVVGVGTLLGALLSQIHDPRFIWLSAFFGAGLLLAGLTNTCALATGLRRMPWNR